MNARANVFIVYLSGGRHGGSIEERHICRGAIGSRLVGSAGAGDDDGHRGPHQNPPKGELGKRGATVNE